MKTHLLWDCFLAHWLAPDRATGDRARDIAEALRATYPLPDGRRATFAQKGGLSTVIVTEETTVVASRIPPRAAARRPNRLDWRGPLAGGEQRALLDGAVRDLLARPRPHVVLRTGRRPFAFDEIVLGGGTAAVVNEPDRVETVDAVRIARARRALATLGSANRARSILKSMAERERAAADGTEAVDEEDAKMRKEIARLKVEPDAFFDALDLLEGVSARELRLAGEKR